MQKGEQVHGYLLDKSTKRKRGNKMGLKPGRGCIEEKGGMIQVEKRDGRRGALCGTGVERVAG